MDKFSDIYIYKLEEIQILFKNKDWPAITAAVARFSSNIFENDKDNNLFNLFMEILAHKEVSFFAAEAIIDRLYDIFEDHKNNQKLKDLLFHHAVSISEHDDNRWKNKKAIEIIIDHRELFDNLDLITNHKDEMIQEYIADDLPLLVPRSPSS